MGANWGKQGSSKILAAQPLTYSGSGTVFSTNFTAETYQIRVISQIPIWMTVLQSTATMFSTSTGSMSPAGVKPKTWA